MRKIQFALVALLSAAMMPLAAAPPPKAPAPKTLAPETIIETNAASILLPESANGLLVVKECISCAPRSFAVTAVTAYRVNERPVGLVEFRNSLKGRPKVNINVVLATKTQQLLLLDATSETGFGPSPPARNKAK